MHAYLCCYCGETHFYTHRKHTFYVHMILVLPICIYAFVHSYIHLHGHTNILQRFTCTHIHFSSNPSIDKHSFLTIHKYVRII